MTAPGHRPDMSADNPSTRGEVVRTTPLIGETTDCGRLLTSADTVRAIPDNSRDAVRIEYRARVPRQMLGAALVDALAAIAYETGQPEPAPADTARAGADMSGRRAEVASAIGSAFDAPPQLHPEGPAPVATEQLPPAPADEPATPRDLPSLIGEWVTVSNPAARAVWQGRLVGLADVPSLILDSPGGGKAVLPQAFDVRRTAPPTAGTPSRPDGQPRPFAELRDTGLLWLINRVAFHPRGLALALHTDDSGDVLGWSLHANTARDPWQFDIATDSDGHTRAEATITAALTTEEN